MAKTPPKGKDPEPEAEGEEQPPKKKGKLPLIIGLVVLIAAVGGGAWFFMLRDKSHDAEPQQVRAQPAKPPLFVPLDAFTVNLSSEQSDQYLQVAATLKVLDQSAADSVKQYMPEVRHRILVLLSTKKVSEIASGEGRERLAEELRQTANNVLLAAAGRPVKPVMLDVRPSDADAKPDSEAEAPKPENETEAAKPEEGAPAAAPAVAAGEAGRPTSTLAKAADDDPLQSVFFTSFIIQ
ncbi:MAG: flagellar basal body-associated FliL family protein [Rhodocyclaceae bacterium]|nr:flagellar basal body-associated FliL family protein [Rhodocyclaceae bacterium]MCO5097984.1 flagellar basal body-associated FliL family protein [Rhodocyclaceae bacterium]